MADAGGPSAAQQFVLPVEIVARLGQEALCGGEIGARRAECVFRRFRFEPRHDLRGLDPVPDVYRTPDHPAADPEGQADLGLRPDLAGQRDRLARFLALDRDDPHRARLPRLWLLGRFARGQPDRDGRQQPPEPKGTAISHGPPRRSLNPWLGGSQAASRARRCPRRDTIAPTVLHLPTISAGPAQIAEYCDGLQVTPAQMCNRTSAMRSGAKRRRAQPRAPVPCQSSGQISAPARLTPPGRVDHGAPRRSSHSPRKTP